MYPVLFLLFAVFAVRAAASQGDCPPDYLVAMERCEEPVKNEVFTDGNSCKLLLTSSCELAVIERCREKVMVDFKMTSQDYDMVVASMRAMVEDIPESCKFAR